MAQLIAALADFLVCDQDAVHGADRAVVDALVEQAGIDLSGRLVGEARCAQKTEHGLAFHGGKFGWNGHYGCTCYHPLFVFNQFGERPSLWQRSQRR